MADDLHKQNEETGRLAGFGAGVLTGMRLGTVLIPIPFVGSFTGALVGGAIGGKIGQRIGAPILNAIDSLTGGNPTASQPRATSVPITNADEGQNDDLLARLERLGQLRAQELLTEEEFAAAKAQLLNR
jgi:phage tail tape-measure protein